MLLDIAQPAMLYDTMSGNYERTYTQDVSQRDAYVKMNLRQNSEGQN